MDPNFPPGKLPGMPEFPDTYFNMSQGEDDARGPWNEGERWDYVEDREAQSAVDGDDGSASVGLNQDQTDALAAMAARTASDPASNPVTGADLGAGPGAGATTAMQ